jgi:membrane protein involved in colicin uptake
MKILWIPVLAATAIILSCNPNEAAKAEAAKAEAAKAEAAKAEAAKAEAAKAEAAKAEAAKAEAAKAEAAKAEAEKITESEFYSLKKADDALIKWTKELFSTYLAGRSFTDNDNVKEIMDGAIIKSDIGKKIRANIQDTLRFGMVFAEIHEKSNLAKLNKSSEEMTELAIKIMRLSDLERISGNLESCKTLLDKANEVVSAHHIITEEIGKETMSIVAMIKEFEPEIIKLEKDREQMFKQMRDLLEK